MKIVIIIFLITLITCESLQDNKKGSYCNGNCPKGDCQECVCGTTNNTVDINNWCKGAKWDQACCRCIVSIISKGNANYMRNGTWGAYAVGLLGIQGNDGDYCGARENYDILCNPDAHLNCAYKLYSNYYNTWKYWQEAKACGCSVTTET